MTISSNIATRSGKGLAGDARELARQLGSLESLDVLGSALAAPGSAMVADPASFSRFLSEYMTAVLIPVELPLVCRGFLHASQGATAELISLDKAYVPVGLAAGFAEASQMVGRSHLRRMRPLRGERRVQRYWQAVQRGEAHGWHMVVYGLVLAVYALPLRQGLLNLGRQTIHGFIASACNRRVLDAAAGEVLEQASDVLLVSAVEALLTESRGPKLLRV